MVIVDKLVKSPDCESGICQFEPDLSPLLPKVVISMDRMTGYEPVDRRSTRLLPAMPPWWNGRHAGLRNQC